MDMPLPGRTLTDADAEAIAVRLHALLRGAVMVAHRPSQPQPIEYVEPAPSTTSDSNLRARAAVSDVTPGNVALQDLPRPMINALLARRASRVT